MSMESSGIYIYVESILQYLAGLGAEQGVSNGFLREARCRGGGSRLRYGAGMFLSYFDPGERR